MGIERIGFDVLRLVELGEDRVWWHRMFGVNWVGQCKCSLVELIILILELGVHGYNLWYEPCDFWKKMNICKKKTGRKKFKSTGELSESGWDG